MKFKGSTFIALFCCFMPSVSVLSAADWWARRGVLSEAPENNYQVVNVGQAKHMAKMAIAELDETLYPLGGAQFSLSDIVEESSPWIHNYVALTVGQLKFLAHFFYDRLEAVGYPLPATDHPNGYYPWAKNVSDSNVEVVNVGQLKYVFNWNFTHFTLKGSDSDSDGLFDRYETSIGTSALSPDTDGDGVNDGVEVVEQGTDPLRSVLKRPALNFNHKVKPFSGVVIERADGKWLVENESLNLRAY